MAGAKCLNSSFDSLIICELIKELGRIISCVPLALTFLVNLEGFVIASKSTGLVFMNSATKSTDNTIDVRELENGYS